MAKATQLAPIQVESLAVTHRPRSILQLYGQDHIISQVRGMVETRKLPAGILVSGNSGCGKTTTSRIITRTMNCSNLDPKTYEPCGECQSCALGEESPDYNEVNVGANGGVDNVRALIRGSRAQPSISNLRIIMLDEAHALTGAAANALLKVLEEPPKRTLWILATTNPEKLLDTIRGRCIKLNLTSIAPEVIAKRVRIISKREGVDLKALEGGTEIVQAIVDMSDGRMRDAISLLESALFTIKSSKDVDVKTVLTNFLKTGEADLDNSAAQLLVALLSRDLKLLVRVVRSCGNCRAVMSKLRWIVQFHLDNFAGMQKYVPYGVKLFNAMAKKHSLALDPYVLIRIQSTLVALEERFNRMSVDESVLMLSSLGEFVEKARK